jgi:hypothetical protein
MPVTCYDSGMHFFMSDGFCVSYTDINVQKEGVSFFFDLNILYKDRHYIVILYG